MLKNQRKDTYHESLLGGVTTGAVFGTYMFSTQAVLNFGVQIQIIF
jgi:hypothetical protein